MVCRGQQFLKQLSLVLCAHDPAQALRTRGGVFGGPRRRNGEHSGAPFPSSCGISRPEGEISGHPHPAFWLQAVWVGGAGTSGMLMPAVEGPSLEKERGEGRYLRSASRGRGLGPGRGVANRQPPDGQE